MSKRSVYSKWNDRIKLAREYKKKVVEPKMIQRFLDYYKGNFYQEKSTADRIAVNQVHPNVKLLQAALGLNSPTFKVIADDPAKKSREVIIETLLDSQFERMKFPRTLRKCTRDAHLNWGGVAKNGYSFKLAREILGDDIQNVEGKKDEKSIIETAVYHEYIKSDSTYCIRKSPNLFFMSPDATENLTDASWCFESIIWQKDDIEKYFGIDMGGIPATIAEWLSKILKDVGLGSEKEISKGVINEIYDLKEAKRICFIEGSEKAFEYDWNYDFFPYSTLIFNENPDENYGTPDVKLYESQQLELNKIRTLMMNTINKNNPRFQMLKGSTDKAELEKFLMNEISSVIEVNAANAIMPIQTLQVDQNLPMYESFSKNDIKEIMGIDEVMKGGQQAVRKSATETATRDYYARLRIGERKQAVDDFAQDVAEKQLKLMQKEYTVPRFIKLVGAEGKYLIENTQDKTLINEIAQKPNYTGQFPVQADSVGADGEKQEGNLSGDYQIFVRTSSYTQNKQVDSQRLQGILPWLSVNPAVSPVELTNLVKDVCLDGFETSKLIIPNAFEVMNDPLAKERFQQIMMSMGKGAGQPGRSPTGPGSAGPGMTEAKMGSEAQQPQGPQGQKVERNTMGPVAGQ